jgi:8-oxo-dGTP pyrophosphatase MutT (NUDIX family)
MASVCSNCGKYGHYFRECEEPITSLGILAFKQSESGPQWLLIRRRVSIGYIEIMRGKYDLHDQGMIQSLIDQTTMDERHQLLERPFPELWRDLWNGHVSRRYTAEQEQARAKFDVLRSRGNLASAIRQSTTRWVEPEWGFPKGRRSSTETELTCALRETYEEAGVSRKDLHVWEGDPILEEYDGSNGIRYRHRYWLAEAPSTLTVRMDPHNIDQQREISDVRWCLTEEALSLIRAYNVEKKGVLHTGATRVMAKIGAPQQRNECSTSSGRGRRRECGATANQLEIDLSGNDNP